jgi:hypothetical protein
LNLVSVISSGVKKVQIPVLILEFDVMDPSSAGPGKRQALRFGGDNVNSAKKSLDFTQTYAVEAHACLVIL